MLENAAPNNETVYVVPNAYGFQVVPPVVRLTRGSVLTVRNLTQSWVRASFPPEVMIPPSDDIPPQDSRPFTVRDDAPKGVYDYHVIVILVQEDPARGIAAVTLQASGNSEPRIIIDF